MLRTPVRSILPVALAGLLLAPGPGPAQPPSGDPPDMTIDECMRVKVIDSLIQHLDESYIFPETAASMAADLRKRLDAGAYDDLDGARAFAEALTEHLQSVSKDKHISVMYSHEPVGEMPSDEEAPSPEMREKLLAFGKGINFGFETVARLPGNVGYLDLRGFFPATLGGETAAAAMNFVANTDALIIDLRHNGGGDPSMVALLCTYLFPPEPVHLNDLYFRPDDSTRQWWTFPFVPGTRYVDKPVYVLTSGRTFSAGEEFAYNLQAQKRATIVGETTGGGAHPGGFRKLDDHFGLFVPSGRAINPITRTNWEGTGVAPDLCVPSDRAKDAAHLAALKSLLDSRGASMDPSMKAEYQRNIDRMESELAAKADGDEAPAKPE